MELKYLSIGKLLKTIRSYCIINNIHDEQINSLIKSAKRLVRSSEVIGYINNNRYKVVGYLGEFYNKDEYKMGELAEYLKRPIVGDKIDFKKSDNAYDPIRNPSGLKYEWINTEVSDGVKYAVLKVDSEHWMMDHKSGSAKEGKDQIFIKIPKLRDKVDGKYVLLDGYDKILVKNITSEISIIELVSWIHCDVDELTEDSPYHDISKNEYSLNLINLCSHLNNKLGLRIKTW